MAKADKDELKLLIDAMPLYEERDKVAQGDIYLAHVAQMTVQGLYSKSDIAAELAHRDIVISELEGELNELKQIYDDLCKEGEDYYDC